MEVTRETMRSIQVFFSNNQDTRQYKIGSVVVYLDHQKYVYMGMILGWLSDTIIRVQTLVPVCNNNPYNACLQYKRAGVVNMHRKNALLYSAAHLMGNQVRLQHTPLKIVTFLLDTKQHHKQRLDAAIGLLALAKA